jgi:16S rRNA (cytidine1402-2'-O)-methyltransferase
MTDGTLSIVATPIGNLEDITLRALRVLKECDVIYAEDTRVISKLLARYEIQKPLQRLDAATEGKKAGEIIDRLESGEHVVYVSDAGTPGISDPGARLVEQVRDVAGTIRIEAIPGPSALTTLLSIAGLETTGFTFLGFLPHKKGRQTALKNITESELPTVVYESPHRVLKLFAEARLAGIKNVIVGRELTKLHEEVVAGSLSDAEEHYTAHPDRVRGEFVVILIP